MKYSFRIINTTVLSLACLKALAAPSLDPSTLTFPPSPQTVTVKNGSSKTDKAILVKPTVTGTNSADFEIDATQCPSEPTKLGLGKECKLTVTFKGTGASSAVLNVSSPDVGLNVTLNGTGTGEPASNNVLPTADFTVTIDPVVPLTVNLDASLSKDTDGTITKWEWSAGSKTASGQTASITFDTAGTYTVKLIVTDDKQAKSEKTQDVTMGENTENVTVLPTLSPIFSLTPSTKNIVETAQSKFSGGFSKDGGKTFEKIKEGVEVKVGQSLTVSGKITPDPAHVGQPADIIVVGLYTPDVNDSSCDPTKGTYYMMKQRESLYCGWTGNSDWCNPNPVTKRGTRTTAEVYVTAWDGKLDTLAALDKIDSLPTLVDLSGDKSLYSDKPVYTGFVCVNFGYRLQDDGTMIFNGETVNFKVTE